MFEFFFVVVFEDSLSRSQNIGTTCSALVIRRFILVDPAKNFDISFGSVKMTAKHLRVAAAGPRRLLLVVCVGDLFPKTLAGLLIPDDGIVRGVDPALNRVIISLELYG